MVGRSVMSQEILRWTPVNVAAKRISRELGPVVYLGGPRNLLSFARPSHAGAMQRLTCTVVPRSTHPWYPISGCLDVAVRWVPRDEP